MSKPVIILLLIPALIGYLLMLRDFGLVRATFLDSLSWAGLAKYFAAIIFQKIVHEAAKPGNFLQFKQIPNIKILFHRSIHDSLYAKPLHKDQMIDFDETSEYLTLHLPECSEEVVLPWILSQMGKAEILEPRMLREKICDVLSSIGSLHYN